MKRWVLALTLMSGALACGFGSDQRAPVPVSKPYSAVVRVKMNQNGIGCGFLVGPDLMATAAHVVSDEQGKVYPDIKVECGVLKDKPAHIALATEVFLKPDRNPDPASGDDWALVRLDRPVGLLYGWSECRALSAKDMQSLPVELVGFSGIQDELKSDFTNFQTPYACPGIVHDVGPHVIFHDCAMWGGTSGSGILASQAGQTRLVAINSAGVDVEGEVLDHGFRKTYTKDLGNIAVPASNFIDRYKEVFQPPTSRLRKVWIRNNYRTPLRVSVHYKSALADPKEPFGTTGWQEVGSQKRICVLEPEAGCVEKEVFLSLANPDGERVGPKAPLEFEVEGKTCPFFRKYIGESEEYTATYP